MLLELDAVMADFISAVYRLQKIRDLLPEDHPIRTPIDYFFHCLAGDVARIQTFKINDWLAGQLLEGREN